MAVTFSLKIKSASAFDTTKVKTDSGKTISKLITTAIKTDIAGMVGSAIEETVAQHNRNIIVKTAMFFQRVVTRTPKDETYYDPETQTYHKADDDFVWENWKVLYGKKSISAKEMGASFFDSDSNFNNRECITAIAEQIKENLFNGDAALGKRKRRIRSLRIENEHPRFAMLEYGGYELANSTKKEGKKHSHGIKDHYSVQAPYGMLRITQTEMEQMSPDDFDRWIKKEKSAISKIKKIRSKKDVQALLGIIEKKSHLSMNDIDKVTQIIGGN